MTELELIDIFADSLRDKLKEVGISQNQLAEETGISKSSISRYINGELMPSLRNIINICYCLDCDIDDLIPSFDRIEL